MLFIFLRYCSVWLVKSSYADFFVNFIFNNKKIGVHFNIVNIVNISLIKCVVYNILQLHARLRSYTHICLIKIFTFNTEQRV